jgi:hypothetical protein
VTTNSNNQDDMKSAICIREIAALCGLSRQRFMQLVKAGVFPHPLYDVATRRPFYTEELQTICLDVRRRNTGFNGKVIMFYARRSSTLTTPTKARKPRERNTESDRHADITDGLKTLGLATVTAAQVASAMQERFPGGTSDTPPAEIVRSVFLHLRGKNREENVGRKD